MPEREPFQPALVVPHFNHADQFLPQLQRLAELDLPLIVVDDASSPDQRGAVEQALRPIVQATLVNHSVNQGKGGAVISGLKTAHQAGYSHVLQIDADGQHRVEDGLRLLAAARAQPDSLIAALPQFDDDIPRARRWGRKLTNFWVAIETLSRRIPDPMCGFRVYPLERLMPLLARHRFGRRMAFDVQILVYADWHAIALEFVPCRVSYPEGGVSHFHYLRDNRDISLMHVALVLGMLPRSPGLIRRWFSPAKGPL